MTILITILADKVMEKNEKFEALRKRVETLKKVHNPAVKKMAEALEQKVNELEAAIAAKAKEE